MAQSLRVPLGSGLTGRAVVTKATVLVDDVDLDPAYLRTVDCVRSELAVPLVARDHVVAVLDLQSADPNAFDRRVSDLLELVASRFSLAIDIAQLYHAQEKHRSTLETLHKIAQEYSSILNLNDLLEKVAGIVHDLIPYDALALYLKDSQRPAAAALFRGQVPRAGPLAGHPFRRWLGRYCGGLRAGRAGSGHVDRSALHRVAGRHPLRSCGAPDA